MAWLKASHVPYMNAGASNHHINFSTMNGHFLAIEVSERKRFASLKDQKRAMKMYTFASSIPSRGGS